MNDRLGRFSSALNAGGVTHECYHDCIHIHLPGDFDILELKVWPDGTDSIQLLAGDFHTHAELLALEYGQNEYAAFALLVNKILKGQLLLIEETAHDGPTRRTIEDSLEGYLTYLPQGTTYRVANGT